MELLTPTPVTDMPSIELASAIAARSTGYDSKTYRVSNCEPGPATRWMSGRPT
ncbi:Uncharacterised protein [Mycobacteroides abscessus subsp. abscessus]|nr:Uncharacterised protein [Mycobacteroides abscessus subsp. abscessus]